MQLADYYKEYVYIDPTYASVNSSVPAVARLALFALFDFKQHTHANF